MTTATDETYNGWTNYETWHAKLILDNEETLYRREQAWGENFLRKHTKGTYEPDKAALAVKRYLVPLVKKQLRAYQEPCFCLNRNCKVHPIEDDMDYSRIDCASIAQHLLDEAIENAEWAKRNG